MSKKNKNFYKENKKFGNSNNTNNNSNNKNFNKNNQSFKNKIIDKFLYEKFVNEDIKILESDETAPELTCCICNNSIEKISLAIDVPDKDTPAHFECVLNRLRATEELKENEKITYIGNRKFAVVVYRKNNIDFDIVREIQYEDMKDFKPWRNSFSVKLKNRLV